MDQYQSSKSFKSSKWILYNNPHLNSPSKLPWVISLWFSSMGHGFYSKLLNNQRVEKTWTSITTVFHYHGKEISPVVAFHIKTPKKYHHRKNHALPKVIRPSTESKEAPRCSAVPGATKSLLWKWWFAYESYEELEKTET